MTQSCGPATPVMAFHDGIVTEMNTNHYRFIRESDKHYPIDSIGPVFRGILPNWLANILFS